MKIDGVESVDVDFKTKTATCKLKSDVKDVAAAKKAIEAGLDGQYKSTGIK